MYEKITLSNLKDGAIEERFQYELKKVLENISDPNTDFNKSREINIKINITPDEARESVKYSIQVTSKMAAIKTVGGNLSLAGTGEKLGLFQETSKQFEIEEEKEGNEIKVDFGG